ncbi:DUF1659 domain-containing protein [[Clostridium] dakarense]|uniref:DUF1659 domain-containing protein n=1 Tax=Faecalimicrobium dakarense TaxID=1301100 RepID=UPI0004B790CE|nr:DUF1659 domain-containing protein [[Clostridium] dakarense]
MALVITKNPSGLKMRFDCGKNENGKTVVKNKTYSNVKATASNEDVYEVATAIANLQEHTLMEVCKIDNTSIEE